MAQHRAKETRPPPLDGIGNTPNTRQSRGQVPDLAHAPRLRRRPRDYAVRN
jgi:hypothetical protein